MTKLKEFSWEISRNYMVTLGKGCAGTAQPHVRRHEERLYRRHLIGDEMVESDPKVEYLDVSNNLRHWNTLRFAELTIYIAIIGAMMNVVFGKPAPLPITISSLVKIAGVLVSILFLILQERTMAYWYKFVERAAELEEVLGFEQYKRRPKARVITGRSAVRLFFLVIILFWVISIFLSPI